MSATAATTPTATAGSAAEVAAALARFVTLPVAEPAVGPLLPVGALLLLRAGLHPVVSRIACIAAVAHTLHAPDAVALVEFVALLVEGPLRVVGCRSAGAALPHTDHLLPYLRNLEASLTRRLGKPVPIRAGPPDSTKWFCVDIAMAGRTLRISFPHSRMGARPPLAALLVACAGALVILLTSLLLVRRLTRPLERLVVAASRIGRGETYTPVPETGPRELVVLTRRFNRMAAEIAQLLSNRTILFAGISHDLRTPLTRMRLALEMLPAGTDPALVGRLRQDLEEMERLIGDTLELARGLEPSPAEEVDLREFVDGVVAASRRDGAVIRWSPAACCYAAVDTLALQRVLTNLLDNALRYGGDQPVELCCFCEAEVAVIQVLDHGPGIPEAERDKVFQPFHRLEGSRSRRTGGSGLGLAIARQLCDVHGWRIRLLPRTEGGLEARLDIPLVMAAE